MRTATEDPWKSRLEHFLGDLAGKLLVEDAWTLVDRPSHQRILGDNERLECVMLELGFVRKRLRQGGWLADFYVRGYTEADRDRMIDVTNDWSEISISVDPGEF